MKSLPVLTELESDLELFRLFFSKSRDAMGLAKNGIHIKGNQAFMDLFGFEDEAEVVGRPVTDFAFPEGREEASEAMRRRGRGEAVPDVYTTRGVRKNGDQFVMEITGNNYTHNKDCFLIAIIRDVTEEVLAEQLLTLQKNIALHLIGYTSVKETLKKVLDDCLDLEHFDCGGIYITDFEQEAISLEVHEGLSEDFLQIGSFYDSATPNYQAVMRGEIIFSDFGMVEGITDNYILKLEGMKSVAVVPVKANGKVIACVNLASRRYHEVPEKIRSVLQAVTEQVELIVTRLGYNP